MNSAQGSLRVSRKIKPIDGTNGVSYELRTSIESVYLNPDGTPKDASFTASLYYISGDSNPTNIHCEIFLNDVSIGSGTSFTIPTSNLRTIYKLTAKVDGVIATEKIIGVVKDGSDGITYTIRTGVEVVPLDSNGIPKISNFIASLYKNVGNNSPVNITANYYMNDVFIGSGTSVSISVDAQISSYPITAKIDNIIVAVKQIGTIKDGEEGLGISSIVKTYNVSASQDTQPTVWLSSIPTMNETSGKYLWMKTVTTYTDGSSITEIHIAAVYGDRGIDSNLLDWVNDWNSTATTIGTNYICSPKAFFGTVNHSNNTITGIALGNIINGYNGISAFNSLGENTFYLDTNGNVKAKGEINATSGIFENVTINESCNVKGTLNGVTGSFKSLDCINTEGVKMGSISFGDDGRIWFDGKMYHQGPGALFYMSNAWIRSDFGAATRNTAYVSGNIIRFKSVLGDQVDAMTQNTDNSGRAYYDVPTLGTNGYASGMPLDEIIIELSSSPIIDKFNIVMYNTRRVLLINSNNNKSLYIYSNGNLIEIVGGSVCELVQVDPSYMSPTPTYGVLGRGLLIGGIKDNNW